uniref:Uncharacterized protein n=1 Tax=Trichobilharzia regenti TaxID=157069 RepID=A0AA85KKX0_TRIRE|nr:unnamed protein product [Trichobilharzia regenti]
MKITLSDSCPITQTLEALKLSQEQNWKVSLQRVVQRLPLRLTTGGVVYIVVLPKICRFWTLLNTTLKWFIHSFFIPAVSRITNSTRGPSFE